MQKMKYLRQNKTCEEKQFEANEQFLYKTNVVNNGVKPL